MSATNIPLEIILWLQSLRNGFLDFFFQAVSWLGEEYFFIIVLGAVYWTVSKRFGEFLGIALASSITLNNTLKGIFNMPRPFEEYPDQVVNMREYTATGSAFPSGHTQSSATLFFSFHAYLKRRALFVAAIVLTILMMLSRMYLGVHYIQDVVVGALLGIGVAVFNAFVFKRLAGSPRKLHMYYLGLVLVFVPAFVLIGVNDFYKGYGILTGIVAALLFEKRFVGFDMDIRGWKKILRLVLGLGLMVAVLIGVKAFFGVFGAEEGTFGFDVLDYIRYFLVAFVGFGVYPWMFKKLGF